MISFVRAIGGLTILGLAFATAKLFPALSTEGGGSTSAFFVAIAVAVAGHALVVLRADRIASLYQRVAAYPIRLSILAISAIVLGWIGINVGTRLGIIFLLLVWGCVLITICINGRNQVEEAAVTLVRMLPLSLVSLCLALMMVEVFLRANPMLVGGGGGGNPALSQLYQDLHHTNSYGFRGDEFSVKRSAESFRIVALGDSFTFGQGVPDGSTYPSRLGSLLNKYRHQDDSTNYEVINAGRSGTDTHEQLELFREKCVSLKPDLVTVQFYMNDLEPSMQATADPNNFVERFVMLWANNSYAVFFLKYRFETLRDYLRGSADGVGADRQWVQGIASRIENNDPGWQRFRAATEGFAETAKQHRIPILFVLLPRPGFETMSEITAIHAAVKNQVERVGLSAIDLADVWNELPFDEQIVSQIDHHPSEMAHELTARRLLREIRNRDSIAMR